MKPFRKQTVIFIIFLSFVISILNYKKLENAQSLLSANVEALAGFEESNPYHAQGFYMKKYTDTTGSVIKSCCERGYWYDECYYDRQYNCNKK